MSKEYITKSEAIEAACSTIPYSVFSNRTLTNEELAELERIREGADNG